MKFDEVLTEIGEFGTWTYQKRLYFFLYVYPQLTQEFLWL